MNVNEVIGRPRQHSLLGGEPGDESPVHPNDRRT